MKSTLALTLSLTLAATTVLATQRVAGAGSVQHVVYTGRDAHIHELVLTTGWQDKDLTQLANGPQSGGIIDAFVLYSGQAPVIDYTADDGDIHQLQGDPTDTTWKDVDLIKTAPNSFGKVVATSPAAYVTSSPTTGDIQHIIYESGDVDAGYELQSDKTGQTWHVRDITTEVQSTFKSGIFSAYAGNNGGLPLVAFLGAKGSIYRLNGKTTWSLKKVANVPTTPDNILPLNPVVYGLTAAKGETQHIAYVLKSDFHVHDLVADKTGTKWTDTDLTKATGSDPVNTPKYLTVNGNLAVYITDKGTVPHIVYPGANNHLHELVADATGATWKDTDLTATTPLPVFNKLSAYTVGTDQTPTFVYVGTDDAHVYELVPDAQGKPWKATDLTLGANGPKAATDLSSKVVLYTTAS